MISNLVNQTFDSIQNRMYSFEMRFSNSDEKLVGSTYKKISAPWPLDNKNPVLSRIVGLPIAIVDVSLETLRSVFLAIESSAFTAISLIAVLWNVLTLDLEETGRAVRITVFNFSETLVNIFTVPFKVVLAPFFALAQTYLLLCDPQKTLPVRNLDFTQFDEHLFVKAIRNFHSGLFSSVNDYAKGERFEAFYAHGYGEEPQKAKNPRPILSRLRATLTLPLADAGLDVVKPFVQTYNFLLGAVGLAFITPFLAFITPFTGNEITKVRHFTIATSAAIGFLPRTIAQTITKIVMFPITLVAQLGAALWDPLTIAPSSTWLYKSQVGDYRVKFTFERKDTHSANNGWRLEYPAD